LIKKTGRAAISEFRYAPLKKFKEKKKETDHYTKLAAAKPYSPKNVDLLAYSSTLLEVRSYYIYNSSKPYIPVSQLNAI